jgi:hypothetical protein
MAEMCRRSHHATQDQGELKNKIIEASQFLFETGVMQRSGHGKAAILRQELTEE